MSNEERLDTSEVNQAANNIFSNIGFADIGKRPEVDPSQDKSATQQPEESEVPDPYESFFDIPESTFNRGHNEDSLPKVVDVNLSKIREVLNENEVETTGSAKSRDSKEGKDKNPVNLFKQIKEGKNIISLV